MYDHIDPRANTVSWLLASEIARRTQALTLLETHPGGGQSDCLTFHNGSENLIHINRTGSIHVRGDWLDRYAEWPSLDPADEIKPAAIDILTTAGLVASKRAHPTNRTTLTYRIVAAALAADPALDARSALRDSSGMDGSHVEITWLGDNPELRAAPPEQVWVILKADAVVARLWDATVFPAAGEAWDAFRLYRRGASVAELATVLV